MKQNINATQTKPRLQSHKTNHPHKIDANHLLDEFTKHPKIFGSLKTLLLAKKSGGFICFAVLNKYDRVDVRLVALLTYK